MKNLLDNNTNSWERLNVESIAVETLEQLIKDLSKDHARINKILERKLKNLQYDIRIKKIKAKEET